MPLLIVGALFDILLTNPCETAHLAMENEGRPCPPPDKMKELRRLTVNSGSLYFVQFQISIYRHSHVDHHLLVASVHRDMGWLDFLYVVVHKCSAFGWFENDPRTLRELVETARVEHGRFDPNSSRPTNPELKSVETSSAKSIVGSVLTHVTTTIKNVYRNVLEISFVRRSSRLEEKECEA